MKVNDQVEAQLNDVFGKKAPQLPNKATKTIVEWAPWATLLIGVLSLWAAYMLWHWAAFANSMLDYSYRMMYPYTYGYDYTPVNHLTVWVWLAIAVLAAEGILYLLAFPGLRAHKKAGWNFLYWGALVNIAYAIVSLFTGYNGFGSFLFSLVGSAIGLWLLFQIRSSYTVK